ncbi:O-methyltransferase [Sulfurihydrogenibium sp.]|uniref:O-methyltransferase n=1 Tax=Sulfurihydrogenibium sp. TaxID=2053621 RepID=UPI0026088E9C|nr:O-methyltransferase [Sulfurihydrogenibium sp.]
MNDILFYSVQLYIDSLNQLSYVEDEDVLNHMEDYAEKSGFPIVNRSVGRFLYLITKLKNPKLIVEIGSGYGYSAYWFAKAIDSGKVVLTDYKPENLEKAKEYLGKSGLLEKVEFRVGNGVEIAKEYKDVDIFFFDHEKSKYLDTVLQLKTNLKSGGLIIADNTLWHGKVLQENPDNQTKKIKEFNEYMFSSKEFFTTLIPLRDGVLIALKL